MSLGTLSQPFLANLPSSARSAWATIPNLEHRLEGVVAAARSHFSELLLDGPEFVAYLAARWPAHQPPDAMATVINLGDLYLAAACVHRCPGAAEALEQHCLRHVPAILSYLNRGSDFAQEVQQMLSEKLLTAQPGEQSKLADYEGRGALLMWVRAAAVRTALHQLDKAVTRKQVDDGDENILRHATAPSGSAAHNPELAAIKEDARPEVRIALGDALLKLTREQRTLLRLYYVEGMRVEEIGALLKVNKSTVSRRLAEARAAIQRELRKALARRIKLTPSEVESFVELVASQLDISLPNLLLSSPEPHE